jgi:hypothetical protein
MSMQPKSRVCRAYAVAYTQNHWPQPGALIREAVNPSCPAALLMAVSNGGTLAQAQSRLPEYYPCNQLVSMM